MCGGCGESQGLHHGVVQIAPDLLNPLILARRMDAICQEHYKQLTVGIDPDGSSCESRVAEAVRRKIVSAQAARRWHRPAEGARSTRELLRRSELRYRRAPQNSLVRIHAAVEQHLAKRRQVWGRAKDSRVSRYTANRVRIFVVHFTLDQAMPVIVVDFRWRNRLP